ncbi:MAG: hypothetical protein WBB22_09600 [Anaerolineae bacterium]
MKRLEFRWGCAMVVIRRCLQGASAWALHNLEDLLREQYRLAGPLTCLAHRAVRQALAKAAD